MSEKMTLKDYIELACELAGGIAELASKIGFSRAAIYKWKDGKSTPSHSAIVRIAVFLHKSSPEELKGLSREEVFKNLFSVAGRDFPGQRTLSKLIDSASEQGAYKQENSLFLNTLEFAVGLAGSAPRLADELNYARSSIYQIQKGEIRARIKFVVSLAVYVLEHSPAFFVETLGTSVTEDVCRLLIRGSGHSQPSESALSGWIERAEEFSRSRNKSLQFMVDSDQVERARSILEDIGPIPVSYVFPLMEILSKIDKEKEKGEELISAELLDSVQRLLESQGTLPAYKVTKILRSLVE